MREMRRVRASRIMLVMSFFFFFFFVLEEKEGGDKTETTHAS
jgi:hypothetical protein